MAFEITDSNFQAEVMESNKLVVIDFWAQWCGPCKMIGPIIEQLADEYADKDVLIGKVDVDTNKEVSMKYGIRSIPTILFIKNGEVIDKHIGLATKQVLSDKITSLS